MYNSNLRINKKNMNIHCTQKIGKPISFMNKQLKKNTVWTFYFEANFIYN